MYPVFVLVQQYLFILTLPKRELSLTRVQKTKAYNIIAVLYDNKCERHLHREDGDYWQERTYREAVSVVSAFRGDLLRAIVLPTCSIAESPPVADDPGRPLESPDSVCVQAPRVGVSSPGVDGNRGGFVFTYCANNQVKGAPTDLRSRAGKEYQAE